MSSRCAAGSTRPPARRTRPASACNRKGRGRVGRKRPPGKPRTVWFVYLVECRDGSLYCGITTDVARRVREHQSGAGARYTRARRPVRLVHQESVADRPRALRRELEIKRMPRAGKLALVAGSRRAR